MADETKKGKIIENFDYKDTARLESKLNPHSRMFSRKRTVLSAREQRSFAQAVKRARFMALVPYTTV